MRKTTQPPTTFRMLRQLTGKLMAKPMVKANARPDVAAGAVVAAVATGKETGVSRALPMRMVRPLTPSPAWVRNPS